MADTRITRRAVLAGAAAATAWAAGPARAFLDQAEARGGTARFDGLVARMTLEEKAGQLTLMAAAWSGGEGDRQDPPGGGTMEPSIPFSA